MGGIVVSDGSESQANLFVKTCRAITGAPRQLKDPKIFHKMSLIPLLAWIGLGADGLSSSSYGPEEAFKALGSHTYLAVLVGLATAVTVAIIAYAYSRIIEHFPHGGGGYLVAAHMLGKNAGVISGGALLVDYILTATVSIASCVASIFSYLPMEYHVYKVPCACFLCVVLIVLNIRGVKESISVLAPIFIVFVVTHLLMLLYGTLGHADRFGPLVNNFNSGMGRDLSTIGIWGTLALFFRAYSLGGGTFTGIEAVSNGLQIMREPKVQTGKKTMLYMAVSLAFTAGLLCICYGLLDIKLVAGKTLNAALADKLFAHWPMGGWIAFVTILAEGALLVVGAQAGFVGGPRVMSNMAMDSWFPRRFANLSERLSMQNGVLFIGLGSIALMLYTHGSVSALVVMYAINVFITFSLSQLGMSRLCIRDRTEDQKWKRHLSVHLVGFCLCATILVITTVEKFAAGGWLTFLITGVVVGGCHLVHRHYARVQRGIAKLDEILTSFPTYGPINDKPTNRSEWTAIQLVSGYNGPAIHTLLSIMRNFPGTYKNIIFASVAVVDSGVFKGAEGIGALEQSVRSDLQKCVDLTRRLGVAADFRMAVATDVVDGAVQLCEDIAKEFPKSVVFTGQVTFRLPKFYDRLLHNETAFAVQRRLQWLGITTVILPIRVRI